MTAIATTSPTGTNAALRNAAPLLIGVALLMVGNGLSSTLLGTRAGLIGFSPTVIGIVLSGYYVGFVAGRLNLLASAASQTSRACFKMVCVTRTSRKS